MSLEQAPVLPVQPRPVPGPRNLHPLSQVRPLMRDRVGYLYRLTQDYGDVVLFKIGRVPVYLVNHPDLIQDILVTNYRSFKKTEGYTFMGRLLGKGILTSDGDFHKRNRALIQPAFHKQRINLYGEAMTERAARLNARWQDGQEIDMAEEMMRLTLSIIAKTLFDTDEAHDEQVVQEALDSFFDILGLFDNPVGRVLDKFPLPSKRRFEKGKAALDVLIYRLIDEHRARGGDQGDVLSMLLEAQREDPEAMPDEQIRDEIVTLFLAGHETTALAMSWTWMLLAQNQDCAGKLHEELANVLGGRPATAEDFSRLPYTRMVMSESMRLYPPAYAIDREPLSDYPLGDFIATKGSFVVLSPYTMHRHPKYWPDAERFDPERWTPEETAKRPKYAYFPFGGGPRVCIGEGFAWLEAVIILATLAQHWQPELKGGHVPSTQPLVTLRPKGGMPMVLHKR
jgi:cytochrome P450